MEYLFIAITPTSILTGVVAPDRVIFMGQIEQIVCKQMTNVKLYQYLNPI